MSSAWSRCCLAAAVMVSCLLAACGGGGDGGGNTPQQLSGSATLQASLDVLVQASIAVQWSGPAGSSPTCALAGGSLPPGMTLSNACVLNGAPTATGTYSPRVTLTASGYAGSITVDGQLTVAGPELGRSSAPTGTGYVVGDVVSKIELVGLSYTLPSSARSGDVLTYSVTSGTLPAGLTLDPATGTVSGTPTQAETQTFSIGATLTRGGGSYTLAPYAVTLGIGAAPVDSHAEGGWFAEPAGDPYAYRGVMLDDGTLWLAYGTLQSSNLGTQFGAMFLPVGFMTGKAAPSRGTVPAFTLNDFQNTPPTALQPSGIYLNSSLFTLRFGSSSLVLTKPQASAYDYAGAPVKLGSFNGRVIVNSSDTFSTSMSFAEDGTIQGLFDNRCGVTGTYAARSGKNVFDVRLGATCFGGPYTGVAFSQSFLFNGNTINQVVMMLTNASGSGSLLVTSQ